MKILTEFGYIEAVALFFELTDEQLERIRNNKDYFLDKDLLKEFNSAKGNNAHFFGISNSNGNPLNIHSYFLMLLKEYKTISWWDKEMNEFKLIRR